MKQIRIKKSYNDKNKQLILLRLVKKGIAVFLIDKFCFVVSVILRFTNIINRIV